MAVVPFLRLALWWYEGNPFPSMGSPDTRHRDLTLPLLVLSGSLLLALAGCSTLGPRLLKGERGSYNLALQYTNDEQLLLNVVRLRYRDTPVFLEVGSLSTQFSFEASTEAGAELNGREGDLFTLGTTAVYATRPTVTYTPLQGEDFSQRLLSPLNLETLMLLSRSGWPLKRVLRLCVQRLNQVRNAPRAGGPTPGRAPEYKEFARLLTLIGELYEQDAIDLVYETLPMPDRQARVVLQFTADALARPETRELLTLLQLAGGRRHYPLTYYVVEHEQTQDQESLSVETRSLLGILFLLSQSVEVPERDMRAGKVTVTRDETGSPFDWRNVTGDLLRIQSAPTISVHAAVAVQYRGSWFYIDDTDLGSKSTFSLLSQLFALQAGKIDRLVPLLTLPVGQ